MLVVGETCPPRLPVIDAYEWCILMEQMIVVKLLSFWKVWLFQAFE